MTAYVLIIFLNATYGPHVFTVSDIKDVITCEKLAMDLNKMGNVMSGSTHYCFPYLKQD